MRVLAIAAILGGLGGVAAADATFGGFSGVDKPYLVNPDKACTPLPVSGGAARGMPACAKASPAEIVHYDFKPPAIESGPKATFTATASGRTLTISRGGAPVIAWDAPDPITKVIDVFGSPFEDRVAVAYQTRRLGKEVSDVIAFDLGLGHAATELTPGPATGPAEATPVDPAVAKAADAARKAPKGKQLAAWQAVLAADAANSEAMFGIAAANVGAHRAEALASLKQLAASKRADAVEFLVEARFDPAFAPLRADPAFRAAVGLDRKAQTPYERLMGFGGQWEQSGTSCDKPQVNLVAKRDRSVQIRVKSACEGAQFDQTFRGTWRLDGDTVVLSLGAKGKAKADDEAPCAFQVQGDEDALKCAIGRDLDFVVLPTRR